LLPWRLLSAFIFFGELLSQSLLLAADSGILRGFVSDSASSEPVPFANVTIRGTRIGGTTNVHGYYLLPAVPPGRQTLVFSCLGYKSRQVSVEVRPGEITQVNAPLVPGMIELDELVVIREKRIKDTETDLGQLRLSARDLRAVPAGLEADLFRTIQTAPGIGMTGDVTARYYVRGGGSDQNLLLLDGVTVYNPFHALGLFSVIDPEIISTVELSRGGFSAAYGGRLSSITGVSTREGNRNGLHGSVGAGLLSVHSILEGPLPDGAFLISGRKSYRGDILSRYLNGKESPFDFYDVSFRGAYANPDLDENGTFVLHGFLSGDRVRNDDPFQEDYSVRNNIIGILWRKAWQSPLYSNLSLSYSGLNAEVDPKSGDAKPRENTVSDISLDLDCGYLYPSKDELAFGVQTKFLSTHLRQQNLYGVETDLSQSATDLSAYLDYRFYRWETFGLSLGTRIKFLALTQIRPFLFEVRGSTTYRPEPFIALKAAVGWYSQEVTTLTDENEIISVFEPWVIVPDYLAAPGALHFLGGITFYLSEFLRLECEAYYKPMSNLIDLNTSKFLPKHPDFVNADGEAYGTEFLLRFEPRTWYAQATYAFSRATKTINGVTTFPRYDVRHAVGILLGMETPEGWDFHASFQLKSGFPFTPMVGFYDRLEMDPLVPSARYAPFEPVTLWGERNSLRLPVYHRLDISAGRSFRIEPVTATIGASIINVYDRKNIYYFDRDTGETTYMLRFTPSVTLKVQW
jgi:outer membrane receptor protein involved in Fe transport